MAGCVLVLPASPGAAAVQAPSPARGQEPAASAIDIEHAAPACVQAGKYARLDACFRPASALARARVYFRKGGTADWFYVEMAPFAPCHRALLPRPRKDIGRIEYYIAATDRRSSESRTRDNQLLVTADGTCAAGPLAPAADAGSVVIGSASGAAPAGFLTGGVSPLLIAGGAAVVVGGGAALVLAGGSDETPTTTTSTSTTSTTSSTSSTTTSSTTSTTSTSSTTTTTQPPATTTTTTTMPCESPNRAPVANLVFPAGGALGGTSTPVTADASDPSPGSGIREVRFYYIYRPLSGPRQPVQIGTDTTGPPYSVTWTLPSCGQAPEDLFRLVASPVDNCGNVGDDAGVDVRSVGRGCFRLRATTTAEPAGSWRSELEAPGARGQVVVDGALVVFPGAGAESFATPLAPGTHRFEATLVDGPRDARDAVARWRFDVSSLRLVPGSLRVVAGDAVQTGADALVFRLRGRAGERVVFVFETR